MSLLDFPRIEIQPWTEADLWLLEKLNAPDLWKELGGPESPEKVRQRHQRFLDTAKSGKGQMFKIMVGPSQQAAGSIGYWESTWRADVVYETGWFVLSEYQGKGIAGKAALQVIPRARREKKHKFLYAFPAVSNAASNAICRKAGFTLLGECDFEFPPGTFKRGNEWRVDLFQRE